jgi:hypothetical protein
MAFSGRKPDARRSVSNAGSTDGIFNGRFFRPGATLRSRLREIEVVMSHTTLIVLMVTVATLIYLVITLLFPEKF